MPDSRKTTTSAPATPSRTRAKKSAAAPAKSRTERPAKPGPAKPAISAPAKPAAAAKKPSKRVTRAPAAKKRELSPEQRRHHVELAAYFIAERHGFTPGREHEDWIAAEAEIDRMLEDGTLKL